MKGLALSQGKHFHVFRVGVWLLLGALGVTNSPSRANPVTVTVGGVSYAVTYENLQYNTSSKFNSSDMPWWGSQSLAGQFASAVGSQLGVPVFGSLGPLFGWQDNGSGRVSVWFYDPGGAYYSSNPSSNNYSPYSSPQIANCPTSSPSKTISYDYALASIVGIVSGTPAYASSPYSTTFAGGTLVVDQSGTFSTSYNTGTGGSIQANGLDAVFAGIFSGAGSLSFVNSGQSGYTSLNGLNTYTGVTTVGSQARLVVNGSIASSSSLSLSSGGSVYGTGSLPQTNLVSGAKIAPGNSIGTITVAGLDLNGGTIDAEIQGPQNDLISVTGQVTNFNGTGNLISYGGGSPWPNFTYTIVSAPNSADFATSTSLTLDQSGVTSALLLSGTTLIQNADGNPKTFDVQWQPRNGFGATASAMQALGQGYSNQLATAGAVDRVFRSLASNAANNAYNTGSLIGSTGFTTGQASAAGISSGFLSATSQLLSLTSNSQLTAAINSLSPEPYAAFQAVGLNSLKQQRELLATHAGSCKDKGWVVSMPNAESSVPGKTGAKLPICVFADAAKSNSSINGSEGLSSYLSNSNVAYWGIEYFPSNQWTVGAAYGYGSSSLYGMSLTSAGVSSTNNSGAVYGVYKPIERLKLRTAFGYTGFSVEGTRTVSFIGNGQPINGNTSANGYTTSFDAKYDIPINTGSKKDWLVVSPIAGIAWGAYQQKGFEETGGGATDLQVNGHTSNSLVGTIGFELSTTPIKFTKSGNQSFAPKLALTYQVDALANANYTKELTASFVDAPGAGVITTQGQNGGANSFTITAGGDLKVYENAALYATVTYEVENAGSQFGYSGGVRFLF